jgi:hypothetical protein
MNVLSRLSKLNQVKETDGKIGFPSNMRLAKQVVNSEF